MDTKRTFKIQKVKIKMAILQVFKSYFNNLQSFFKTGKVHNKNLEKLHHSQNLILRSSKKS